VTSLDVPVVVARGARAFNRGRYLEAQEIWEAGWHAAEVDDRGLLEALVQLAGGVHLRIRREGMRGAEHLLSQALATLEDYQPSAHGLDVVTAVAEFTAYVAWVRSVRRPHRFTDTLRIPRLVVRAE
jgi:predicted metal-dependent hydrolase